METETLNRQTSYIRNKRVVKSSFSPHDFPEIIKNMKNTPDWKKGNLVSEVLLKNPYKQIVLTLLHDNTEVLFSQPGNSVTFQILEGKIKFRTSKKTFILNNGHLLAFHDNNKFSITSLEKSAFLLTLLQRRENNSVNVRRYG